MSIINGNRYRCKVIVTTTYEFEMEAVDGIQASFEAGARYQSEGHSRTTVEVEIKEVGEEG
jgi:hypothetical protein